LDVAFVGPNDLHASIGLTPSTEGAEPEFMAALERIKATAKKYRVAAGIMSSSGPATLERLRQDFQMITVTTDITSLITTAKHELHIARGE
jgi:4-hydroxy-2-oxoheptanedioate aldolase